MITLKSLYALAGAMFAAIALLSALDRANPKRLGNAAFWGLMALSLLAGDYIGNFGNGLLVIGLAVLAGFGYIGRAILAKAPAMSASSLIERRTSI